MYSDKRPYTLSNDLCFGSMTKIRGGVVAFGVPPKFIFSFKNLFSMRKIKNCSKDNHHSFIVFIHVPSFKYVG